MNITNCFISITILFLTFRFSLDTIRYAVPISCHIIYWWFCIDARTACGNATSVGSRTTLGGLGGAMCVGVGGQHTLP